MFQRYVIKTNGGETNPTGRGALLSMQERDFAAVTTVPDKAEFVRDVHPKNRPSSYNPVMEKWFSYSYLANVLVPKPLLYLVRTHDGKYAKMHILSYYCANKSAIILTFEYVYQDGSPRLAASSASRCLEARRQLLACAVGGGGVPAMYRRTAYERYSAHTLWHAAQGEGG